jgi:hypothetical protein
LTTLLLLLSMLAEWQHSIEAEQQLWRGHEALTASASLEETGWSITMRL